MVPSWVLLKREILFEHDASASGGASEAREESMGGPSAGGPSDPMRRPRSGEEEEAKTSMRRPRSGEEGEEPMSRARSRHEEGVHSMRRARSRHDEDVRGETAEESMRRARSRREEEDSMRRARSRQGGGVRSTRRSRSRHDEDVRGETAEESMRRARSRHEEEDSMQRAGSRQEGGVRSMRRSRSRHEVDVRGETAEESMRRARYRHEEELTRPTRSRREDDSRSFITGEVSMRSKYEEEDSIRRLRSTQEEEDLWGGRGQESARRMRCRNEEGSWRRVRAGPSCMGSTSGTVKVPSRQDIKEAILVYLQSLKPDAHFANPPELSSLRLLRPTKSIPELCEDIISSDIASADRNLVALYAGPYRPGNNLKGGYLIYDTSKNSLSTIPQPPYDYSREGLGLGAVVICLEEDEEDTYLLAELTKVRGCGPPEAALSIWRPSAAEWAVKIASFPPELCLPYCVFEADMCFSYQGSVLCWVDLFKGMVICDLMLHIDGCPKFRHIPLPRESMAYDRFESPWRPEEFRSVACVGDTIKFVTMDGYGQQRGNELSLTVWTLSTDLCGWNKVNEYFVRDIWASNAYLWSGLPTILPLFPVLSMDEDGVVYLVVTHRKVVDCEVEYLGQYLLRVDMQHHKVCFCPQNTEQIDSQLFASQCSAYVSRDEDHQKLALRCKASQCSAYVSRVEDHQKLALRCNASQCSAYVSRDEDHQANGKIRMVLSRSCSDCKTSWPRLNCALAESTSKWKEG